MLLQAQPGELPGGYAVGLIQSLLVLVAVCVLAWVVLRWAASRGLGTGQRVKVIERVILDGKRTLWLVRVGDRVLLIGAGDSASPSLLAELDPRELGPEPSAPSFGEVAREETKPEAPAAEQR